MSKYTNVILFISVSEDDLEKRVSEVNKFKHNNREIQLIDINKNFEFDAFPRYTFVGCYNYFETEKFILHIKENVSWDYPEYVQLIIQEENFEDCSFYTNAGKTLQYKAIEF